MIQGIFYSVQFIKSSCKVKVECSSLLLFADFKMIHIHIIAVGLPQSSTGRYLLKKHPFIFSKIKNQRFGYWKGMSTALSDIQGPQ